MKSLKTKGYIAVRSRHFRNFLARLYGWGASVVILGALFKINHYAYADEILLVGLGTEAIIFFFSAFEPPHVEVDWSLVYPELEDLYIGNGIGKRTKKQNYTQQLDAMLKDANIDSQLIDNLAVGLRNLSDNTAKMKDVTNASLATNEYVDRIRSASASMSDLSDTYKKTANSLGRDIQVNDEFSSNVKQASYQVSELTKSFSAANDSIKADITSVKGFSETVKNANDSAKGLVDNYKKSSDIISKSAEALDFSEIEGSLYNQQLKKISETMVSLNKFYEIQLQNSNQQVESSAKLQETMNLFLANLKDSADGMVAYKKNMDELNEKMAALNNVYSGMLSAMSSNTNRL